MLYHIILTCPYQGILQIGARCTFPAHALYGTCRLVHRFLALKAKHFFHITALPSVSAAYGCLCLHAGHVQQMPEDELPPYPVFPFLLHQR